MFKVKKKTTTFEILSYSCLLKTLTFWMSNNDEGHF